jgi:predicted metal-binding transcription factor (methanogenesis marker protein 9)
LVGKLAEELLHVTAVSVDHVEADVFCQIEEDEASTIDEVAEDLVDAALLFQVEVDLQSSDPQESVHR